MDITLSDFSYYFQLVGTSGGLSSMDVEFTVHHMRGGDANDLKAAARRCMATYGDVLDGLFGTVIQGEKKPQMTDTPYAISTGYRYVGNLRDDAGDGLAEHLRGVFGAAAVDRRGENSPIMHLEAKIQCSFRKSGAALGDCKIKLTFNLNHMLNVCFFNFTQQLDGIAIKPEAGEAMSQLADTLRNTLAHDDVDYCDALLAQAN